MSDLAFILSPLYARSLARLGNLRKIRAALYTKAKEVNLKREEIIYLFCITALKNDIFFSMEKEVRYELLYDALYHASKKEAKSQTRPKSADEARRNKKDLSFTSLQTVFIKELCNYFDKPENKEKKEIHFGIELKSFFALCFEISCIKRDRGK